MAYNLFNNNNQNNPNIIGKIFENYCHKHAVVEKIYVDSKESKIEKDIREIFNQNTYNLTIFDDISKIEESFKTMSLELRTIIPYFNEPLSTTNFKSRATINKISQYYNLMQYSTPNLSELVEEKMLLCSGENLLFLKSIPKNGFKMYHQLTEKKQRRTHSLLATEFGDFSLILDLSENKVEVKETKYLKDNFLNAIIH